MDKPFVLLVIIIICIIIIYKYNEKPIHHHIHINTPHINSQPFNEKAINVNVQTPSSLNMAQQPIMLPDPITNIDLRNINDPLTGPIRRPTRDAIGPMVGNPLFNIYTQGPPDSYSWLGILTSSETTDKNNKLLKLFGRQRYPNSTTWDYYVQAYTGGASGDTIKISLDKNKYRRELYDGDSVDVQELGMSYNVKLNRDDVFTYNPYLI